MAEKFPKPMNNNQPPDPSSENAKEEKHNGTQPEKDQGPSAEHRR